MIKLVRIGIGVIFVAVLANLWLPERAAGYWLPIGLVLVGITAGLLIGSWWSMVLVPVTIGNSFWLWRQIECAGCVLGREPLPVWLSVAFLAAMVALAALGAAIGTLGAKQIEHRYRPRQRESEP